MDFMSIRIFNSNQEIQLINREVCTDGSNEISHKLAWSGSNTDINSAYNKIYQGLDHIMTKAVHLG